MATEKSETNDEKDKEGTGLKPDKETLNTTDPQEHMSGPLSSLMKKAEEGANENEQVDTGKDK